MSIQKYKFAKYIEDSFFFPSVIKITLTNAEDKL